MNNEKISVLLVEDDPMVQEVNRQFINDVEGFKVLGVASEGQRGLELIKKLKPDLVLLDIFMAGLDGLDTLRTLRAKEIESDVIMITAADDFESVQKALNMGAFDYIIKPFKFERIKNALEKYKQYVLLKKKNTVTQHELDELMFKSKQNALSSKALPKGLNAYTLN